MLRPPWTGSQSDARGAWSHSATCGAAETTVWGLHVTLHLPSAPQGFDSALPHALQGVIDLVANKAITWDGEELGATFQARQGLEIQGSDKAWAPAGWGLEA